MLRDANLLVECQVCKRCGCDCYKTFYIIILSAILQTSSALGLCRPCDIQLIEVGASKSNNRL